MKTAKEVHNEFIMPIIYKTVLCKRLEEKYFYYLSRTINKHAVITSIDTVNNCIEIAIHNQSEDIIESLRAYETVNLIKKELYKIIDKSNIFKISKNLEMKFVNKNSEELLMK
jgi:hypothetical protein